MTKREYLKLSMREDKEAMKYFHRANKCKTYEGWKRNFEKMEEHQKRSFEYFDMYRAL